jgi:hypothetical protein
MHLYDFVAGAAFIGENVLQSAEIVRLRYFRTDLFADLAGNGRPTGFTKFNTTAEWAVEGLALGRITRLDDENVISSPEYANGECADMSGHARGEV